MSDRQRTPICRNCKHEFDEDELVDGLCFDCRVKAIRRERRA